MSDATRLAELLLQWEDALEGGNPVTPEELCADWPEGLDELRRHTAEVERLSAHHEADPMRHAASIARDLKPKMDQLRAVGDTIESLVPASLWPLPTYRDLLFLK